MAEKDRLPSLRDLGSYGDVLVHIATRHGEEGNSVANDRDQAPFGWHEMVGHAPGTETDHEHYGDHAESAAEMMSLITRLIGDKDFQAQVMAAIEDPAMQDELAEALKFLEDNN